jgi:hypothetical protein
MVLVPVSSVLRTNLVVNPKRLKVGVLGLSVGVLGLSVGLQPHEKACKYKGALAPGLLLVSTTKLFPQPIKPPREFFPATPDFSAPL